MEVTDSVGADEGETGEDVGTREGQQRCSHI